jgi:hypothetical protein
MSVASDHSVTPRTRALSDYIAAAATRDLPPAVAEKTGHHILDSLAAIMSGSRLKAGELAINYVKRLGGAAEATLIGTPLLVPVESASLANAMAGHADETDDSHLRGRYHPGCGIVPAALAVAEFADRSGADFLRAVALGYDIGTRFNMSLGYPSPNAATHSTHTIGVNFGAAAAAAALRRPAGAPGGEPHPGGAAGAPGRLPAVAPVPRPGPGEQEPAAPQEGAAPGGGERRRPPAFAGRQPLEPPGGQEGQPQVEPELQVVGQALLQDRQGAQEVAHARGLVGGQQGEQGEGRDA